MTVAGDLKNLKQQNSQEVPAPRPSSGQAAWWQPAIIMFFKLSAWLAAPIIIAMYLGKWLDETYNTEPWLFLICLGAAFAISIYGLLITAVKELKKFEEENKDKDKRS